jgi:phosphodiesterase/alkaline phosphatase D-like protein
MILGPIIGGLSHCSANLWGRTDGEAVLYAWLGQTPDLSDAILGGESLPLKASDGFAGVAPVRKLSPDTLYYYHLSLSDRLPVPGEYPCFRTAPTPGKRISFNFAFGSCFMPENRQAGQIMSIVEERRVLDDLRFILLLGDQIYADDYRRNFLGRVAVSIDDYRFIYAHNWSHPGFRLLLQNLPAFMILDDHEVDNDWRWLDRERTRYYIPWWDRISRVARGCHPEEISMHLQKVRNALQAYWEHQAMHAPSFEIPFEQTPEGQYSLKPGDTGAFAYTFSFGAAAFFVLDTRTMRFRPVWSFNQRKASMLGEAQWRALESWLLAVKDVYPVKFLVSSSALLFNLWLDIPRDRWSGYRHERQRLLRFLAENDIHGVYLITGDLHSSHAVHAKLSTPDGRAVSLWEFCSSPFDQDGNWLAKHVYHAIKEPPLIQQRCEFIIDRNNFGLVRVEYEKGGNASVRFEVYADDGCLLAASGGRV